MVVVWLLILIIFGAAFCGSSSVFWRMWRKNRRDRPLLVMFDVEPQKLLMRDFTIGTQVVATFRRDVIIDEIRVLGYTPVVYELGKQLLYMLEIDQEAVKEGKRYEHRRQDVGTDQSFNRRGF